MTVTFRIIRRTCKSNWAGAKHPPTECVQWDIPGYRGLKRIDGSVRAVYWMNSFAS